MVKEGVVKIGEFMAGEFEVGLAAALRAMFILLGLNTGPVWRPCLLMGGREFCSSFCISIGPKQEKLNILWYFLYYWVYQDKKVKINME